MNRNKIRGIVLYGLVVLALLWGLSVFTGGGRKDRMSYAAVVDCFQKEQVAYFVVDSGGLLTIQGADGAVGRHALADVDAFRRTWAPSLRSSTAGESSKTTTLSRGSRCPCGSLCCCPRWRRRCWPW